MVFWESQLSIFWLKSVWVLCACGQHAVNFLFGGSLVFAKKLKGMVQDIIYSL